MQMKEPERNLDNLVGRITSRRQHSNEEFGNIQVNAGYLRLSEWISGKAVRSSNAIYSYYHLVELYAQFVQSVTELSGCHAQL